MSNFIKVMLVALLIFIPGSAVFAQSSQTSAQFQGPKANTGTVIHSTKDGSSILTLSDDFVVSETRSQSPQSSVCREGKRGPKNP